MQRGLVTPDRTTLIASTHRTLAIGEKMAPGQRHRRQRRGGRRDRRARPKARSSFDMDALAVAERQRHLVCVFGALAGSGALPFATCKLSRRSSGGQGGRWPAGRSSRAAGAGRKAGDTAYRRAGRGKAGGRARRRMITVARRCSCAHRQELPEAVARMARAGLQKVTDFQDLRYGQEYLDRLLSSRSRPRRRRQPGLVHRERGQISCQRHGL